MFFKENNFSFPIIQFMIIFIYTKTHATKSNCHKAEILTIVLILDGNSEQVAHEKRKKYL